MLSQTAKDYLDRISFHVDPEENTGSVTLQWSGGIWRVEAKDTTSRFQHFVGEGRTLSEALEQLSYASDSDVGE